MKINLFLGGGAARGIWQVGFLSSLFEKKIATGEFFVENIYATSAGNFAGLGLLFGEQETLAHYWNSYDEENFPMFTKTNKLIPLFTWENSSNQLFTRTFFTLMEKRNVTMKCNFYSAVFNINKLKNEWIACHDKSHLEIEQIFFASATIPILYPIKKINDNYCVDAGLLEFFLIKDFLKKHKGETNIILTTFEYPLLKIPKNTYHYIMPDEIKNKINFIENNKLVINYCFNESKISSEKIIKKAF